MESNATPTILSKEKKKSPNITLSLKGQRIKELQGFHNQNQDVPYIKQYAPLLDMKCQPNKLKTDIPLPEISYILRCISGDYQDYQVPINTCGVDIELGSAKCCDCRIEHNEVSPIHCILYQERKDMFYTLTDNNSATGTWLKLSNLETGYRLDTDKVDRYFKFFNHAFTIVLTKGAPYLEVTEGPKKGTTLSLEEDGRYTFGLKACDILFDVESSTIPYSYAINVIKSKIYISNNTFGDKDEGLFLKMVPLYPIIVRPGDVFIVGPLTFKLLWNNWGCFLERGTRYYQEDRICVVDDLRIFPDFPVPFYAVYDGHGGSSCSVFLEQRFHLILSQRLKDVEINKGKHFLQDFCKIVQEIIVATDFQFREVETANYIHHGSTCVCIFIIGQTLICCNLGDSIGIVATRTGQVVHLSKDFKPTRECEKERIAYLNGFIVGDKLLGQISVSRAFGDWKYKHKPLYQHLKLSDERTNLFKDYLISNRAEFRVLKLDPLDHLYIILVSDGIFHNTKPNSIYPLILKNLEMERKKGRLLLNVPIVVDNVRKTLVDDIMRQSVDPNYSINADNMSMIFILL